jgi:uncharacterized membrane protein YidH (DUF202 family)
MVSVLGGDPRTPGEADMGHTRISERHGNHHTIAAAIWIIAGIVAVIAFGDVLTLLAVALAIVATAWWMWREVEHHVESHDARRSFPSRSVAS